jgi:hypothetical protein
MNCPAGQGHTVVLCKLLTRLTLLCLCFCTLANAGPALATDDTPVPEQSAELPTEIATATPTERPALPSTDAATPEPTATWTVVPDTPTAEPTDTPPPTPSPTETPTATSVPPAIEWSQPDPVFCTIKRGSIPLDLGASVVYNCDASIHLTTAGELPSDLSIIWTIQARYQGGSVEIRLPEDSAAELLPPDNLPNGVDARARIRTALDAPPVAFDIIASRTSCTVGDIPIEITADPAFDRADGVIVTRTDLPNPDPYILMTTSASNGQPTVRFDGPLTFEALSATSTGLTSNSSLGSTVVVIGGNWNACTTWTLSLTGGVVGPAVPPQMLVVAVDGVPIAGGECDLSELCQVLTLPATGNDATPLVYTVQMKLVFDPHTLPGSFNVSVSASLGEGAGQQ